MRAIIDTEYRDITVRFKEAGLTPLCGLLWLQQNRVRKYPEPIMTIYYDGEPVFTLSNNDKPTKKAVKAVMDNCLK